MSLTGETLASASGLRPMSAFVVIGAVIVAVALRTTYVAARGAVLPAERQRVERGYDPAYTIVDREGRELSRFVTRFDLVISPRAMWQQHTPERMARRLSEVLDPRGDLGLDAQTLAQFTMPDAVDGVIRVRRWELGPAEVEAVAEWITTGGAPFVERPAGALPGVWLERHPSAPLRWQLVWEPFMLLSAETRAAFGYRGPRTWTRDLARGLSAALCSRVEAELAVLAPKLVQIEPSQHEQLVVWRALMPTAHRIVVEGVALGLVDELEAMLLEESVAAHQMSLQTSRTRFHAQGEFGLLGDWGYASPADTEPVPRSGLELLANLSLERSHEARSGTVMPEGARGAPGTSDAAAASYTYLANRPARRLGERRSYFEHARAMGDVPRVEVSFDLALQAWMHAQLLQLLAEHRPVWAQAIAVEVESGEVLAVDAVSDYGLDGFLPLVQRFTPGSTFKLVTMATALEAGVVQPQTVLDVGNGPMRLGTSRRVIREAEGSRNGELTAAECIAYSSNRGMVLIGQRIPAERFRATMLELGYARAPESGLGWAASGVVPALPWKPNYSHASVCFGHELTTTLWQHAQALATIARGGEWRPLCLVRAVEFGPQRTEAPRAAGRVVFRPETAAAVRRMMELGAREGTGVRLWEEQLGLATKTGTAERVPTELCAHIEAEFLRREGRAPLKVERQALLQSAKPHRRRSCYTSSICVLGQLPGTDRQVLVLVVAEEPRGEEKYGSRVAGPAAKAILLEALGRTVDGLPPAELLPGGFAVLEQDAAGWEEDSLGDLPWLEAAPEVEYGQSGSRQSARLGPLRGGAGS